MKTNITDVKDQLQTAMSIIKELNIPFNDIVNIDDELRIDWKDPKQVAQKITVKCVSHKKRATEPMVPRTRYPNSGHSEHGRNNGHGGNSGHGGNASGHGGGNRPPRFIKHSNRK